MKRPTFNLLGSAGFPACGFTGLSSPVFRLATGKSPEPAGWKACATRTYTLNITSVIRLNLFLFCAFLLGFNAPTAQAQVSREYQLKAVFLYNFAQFTDWPEGTLPEEKSPIVIGILGNDPFGTALEDTVRGETVQGHPLTVAHYRRADEIKTCHILFISQSESRRLDDIVKGLKGKPILTVADTDAPAAAGAIIRFIVENNKVHFRINQESAKTANLTLSSKLLRVAEAGPPGRSP